MSDKYIQRIEELQRELDDLRASMAEPAEPKEQVETSTELVPAESTELVVTAGSRRNLLKLAAGAAAGGVAVAAATVTGKAAAVDTGAIFIANVNNTQGNTGPTSTVLHYINDGIPQVPTLLGTTNGNVFTVRDQIGFPITGGASAFPAAVAGYGFTVLPNGVYGVASMPGGHGVVGSAGSGTGVRAQGGRANLLLLPGGAAPTTRADEHSQGEVVVDANGDLWLCIVAGIPGTWRQVSGPSAAGAFHAIDPVRSFDSRVTAAEYPASGLLEPNSSKTVSVANGHDGDGNVTAPDAVPVGATAVAYNVTVTGTTGPNFLAVTPGNAAIFTTSTINWSAPDQSLANGSIVAIDASRQVKIWGGDQSGSTHVIIDVTGYWL
jgi:hypothetical protein